MHGGVVVGDICLICRLVECVLSLVHEPQVFDILRVAHSLAVGRFGKVGDDEVAPTLGFYHVALAHGHKVKVVVGVKAVHIVGVAGEQPVKFVVRRREVLKLVFQYYTHVVEAFLNDVVGYHAFLVVLGYLAQVVFYVVGVVLSFGSLGVFFIVGAFLPFGGSAFVPFGNLVVVAAGGILGCIEGVCSLVAASPVIFEFAGAPTALKVGFAGGHGGGVVEVP